jgi:hypothetical protein
MKFNFANFFEPISEAKFRDIPEHVSKEAAKIAEHYIKEIKDITPKTLKQLKKIGMSPDWENYFKEEDRKGVVWFLAELTQTEFRDLKTNEMVTFDVYVAFGENNEDYALCDSVNKCIIIFDDNCRFIPKDKLISIMIHEITHGFQQHKTYSKKYEKLLANKSKLPALKDAMYYKEPIEFDAFTTELSFTIRTQFHKLKQDAFNSKLPETKKIMTKRLEKFLLELKIFIDSPLSTYFVYKELPLPQSLETFAEMMQNIQSVPKLWKKFKNKMINLYKRLLDEKENIPQRSS